MAELQKIPLNKEDIEHHYNELERQMLDAFYSYISAPIAKTFLHWNMRDKNYGFQAIEHRHRVLGGTPFVVPDDRKVDLSRLFIELYGTSYIGHPRLENLLRLNNITPRDFMTGKEEAEAFIAKKYVELHRSTLRKVDMFCNLATRAYDKKLRTNSTWKEIYGISWETLAHLCKNHPVITAIGVLGAVVSTGLGTLNLLQKVFGYFRQ